MSDSIDLDDLINCLEDARTRNHPAHIPSVPVPAPNPHPGSNPHPGFDSFQPHLAHAHANPDFAPSPYHGGFQNNYAPGNWNAQPGAPTFPLPYNYGTSPWGGSLPSPYAGNLPSPFAGPHAQPHQPFSEQPNAGAHAPSVYNLPPAQPAPSTPHAAHLPSPHGRLLPLLDTSSPMGALQLSGTRAQEHYPSPPSNPSVSVKEEKQPPNGAPAILVNGAPKPTHGRTSPASEEDFGDDGWIDAAIAEMNEGNAAGQPEPQTGPRGDPGSEQHIPPSTKSTPIPVQLTEVHSNLLQTANPPHKPANNTPNLETLKPAQPTAPPQRRRSPYFAESEAQTVARQEHRPPSRTPSASTVRFPKLGLPLAGHTPPPVDNVVAPAELPITNGPRKFIKKGSVPRVSVYALETPQEHELFTFREFNDMQSTIFPTAYKTDQNMVVSAPTGSGKTTVFELAFLRMLQFKSSAYTPLAIYMAPTKALCSERLYDWRERFKVLNVKCIEVTGDSEIHNVQKYTEDADLIVTTPEKWDSITRRAYMSSVQSRLCLMMIDEIHTLNEERGATLEVVVSRMKKRGDALRFVAVSATVPNIDDVARWIGSKEQSKPQELDDDGQPMPPVEYDDIEQMPKARVFKFGDEYRPVPLTLHAVGVDAPNEFALGSRLDKELWRVLNQHTDGLPTLVFCPTRKACQATAEHLFKEYKNALTNRTRLPWDASDNQPVILKDAKIQKWTELGIGVHHAGLHLLDRRNLEQAFRNSQIHLLVATSTLAVGVNLPAHLVVIKGTSCWAGQGFREYSDIDIQQMMGRAGRPQYDNSGTVVIMCNNNKLHKYQSMMQSKTILESCLHQNLTEHINSEIGLGTIGSLENAQEWLRGTFLSIRIRQNPKHYQETMTKDHAKSWDATLNRFAETSVLDLKKHDFITDDPEVIKERTEEGCTPKELLPTRLGEVMSQTFISYKTMCHIISMDAQSGMREMLELLAGATEFSSLRIRQGEGALLNQLRVHKDIRYTIDTPAKTYADKVFLLAQAAFGNVNLDEFSTKTENAAPLQTLMLIFNTAPRVARAIFNVACHMKYGAASLAALELCHTVNGKAWEHTSAVFRQIDKIGPKSITVLESNGIHTFDDLLKLEPSRIEMWLNRHPPFGSEVLERATAFPRFVIEFNEQGVGRNENGFPTVQLRLQIKNTGQLVQAPAKGGFRGNQNRRKVSYNLVILILSTKNNRFIDKRTINTARLNDRVREFSLEVTLYDPDENIMCVAGVEEKSGLSRSFVYEPRISAHKFPKREEITARTDGTEAGSPKHRKTSGAAARFKEPLFLPADDQDVNELSDGDELIDLTAPQGKRSKKRPRDVTAKPKKRKLALAVKSFIDDEAIDDDEEPEEEDFLDDDDGFIDRGDRPPPSKSARSAGKSNARAEATSAMTSKNSTKSGSSSKASGSASITKSSSSAGTGSAPSKTVFNEHSENIEGGAVAEAVQDPNPPAATLSVDEQFDEWFGQFL